MLHLLLSINRDLALGGDTIWYSCDLKVREIEKVREVATNYIMKEFYKIKISQYINKLMKVNREIETENGFSKKHVSRHRSTARG